MRLVTLALFIFLSLADVAIADDWTVTKLRGEAQQMVGGDWQDLSRGDVVPDQRMVRTLVGRMTLVRGKEQIELGSGTRIQIVDQGGSRPYTTVRQHVGRVEIEAEVRNVEHFAVQTPYLVAIVKGTRFIVSSDRNSSDVRVRRGIVSVTNLATGLNVLLRAGQAAATNGGMLDLSGSGELPPVLDEDGEPALLGALLGGAGDVLSGTTDALGGAVGAVGAGVGGAVGAVGSGAGGAVNSVGSSVGGSLGGAVSSVGGAVESASSTAGSVVSGATGAVGGALGSLF